MQQNKFKNKFKNTLQTTQKEHPLNTDTETKQGPLIQSPCLIPLVGMYQCHKKLCLTCKHVNHSQKECKIKGKTYQLSSFFNCSTEFVVYCLICPCGLHYVGRTIRTLRKRFGEHRRLIEAGDDLHSVPLHFLKKLDHSFSGLRVWIIESISGALPLEERFKRLCQRETYWIYILNFLAPGGLIEGIEVSGLI